MILFAKLRYTDQTYTVCTPDEDFSSRSDAVLSSSLIENKNSFSEVNDIELALQGFLNQAYLLTTLKGIIRASIINKQRNS